MHKKPELGITMKNLEEYSRDFLDDHTAVLWNGKTVCEDIAAYTKQALEKLSCFRQFEE